MRSLVFLLAAATALPAPAVIPAPPAPPPAAVRLQLEVPDLAGPWKMVITNQGTTPVRLAADGRLLRLEIRPPVDSSLVEPPPSKSTAHRHKGPPPPVSCMLPAELRPTGVSEDRAIILGPGARYEEVISPALYCFDDAGARALAPGNEVIARLGFPPPIPKGHKLPLLLPPFVAEPTANIGSVTPLKELVSAPFILPAGPVVTGAPMASAPGADPNEPKIELIAPRRIDTPNERTVGVMLSLKNTGHRPTVLHVRRDNIVFDVDGPDGSTLCGQPAPYRTVAADLFTTLKPSSSTSLEVWIGEMCPDVVFDRPGLYRIRASIAFPNASDNTSVKPWTQTVFAKDPILVRVREGNLPFHSTPPQVFGGAR